jgi:hypothetical protein
MQREKSIFELYGFWLLRSEKSIRNVRKWSDIMMVCPGRKLKHWEESGYMPLNMIALPGCLKQRQC